jgi:hypothetical protein
MPNNKMKDDEKRNWLIIGILFTGFLLAIDICYSSFGLMAGIAKVLLGIAHAVLAILWVTVMAKFKDPNFDFIRKYVVYLSVTLALIIGIHHAVAREDKQVIIDSHENSLK